MKIIFAGTPEFAQTQLQTLIDSKKNVIAVYTQPDRPSGRGQKQHQSPVKTLALNHHIPVYQPKSLKDENAQNELNAFNADVMIVAAYGLILPKAVLSIPRLGCINVHASLLPRWRGAAPIQRAILAGDQSTGITIMQMDEGLDTGDMLYKLSCSIEVNDTAQSLHDRLATLGTKALLETLIHIENHALTPEKQNDEEATYAAKINKTEAQIDWSKTSIEIDRMIRAYNPFPIAYTSLDNQPVKIWKAHINSHSNKTTVSSGTILETSAHSIDVATGDGILSITKMQLPGGKILPIRDILNARAAMFSVGKVFG